jgi:23S rRNA pseudouridine2605 synthase
MSSSPPQKMRLQKWIASSGLMSRRAAEAAIEAGRVTVNGQSVREMGVQVDPEYDRVSVDGKPVVPLVQLRTLLFHKPPRVMTTRFDPEGRKTVMDFLPNDLQSLKPVGRLDYLSEGLLLLTEAGELAHQIMHPSFGIQKCYRVWVEGRPQASVLRQLTQEVLLEDGPGRFESIELAPLSSGPAGRTCLELWVSEGRNRFVRRMLAHVGHPVHRLLRTQIGPLTLKGVPAGAYRLLEPSELAFFQK